MFNRVDYSKFDDREEADKQAIKDTREFLGDRFETLVETAENPEMTVDQLRCWIAFAGVEGYPLEAFLRKYRRHDFIAMYAGGPDALDERGFPQRS